MKQVINMTHHNNLLGTVRASSSILDRLKALQGADSQFRWKDVKNFVYIADAFASTDLNYTFFSEVFDVPVYLFILFTVLFGMPYMCMDVFIKIYTSKIDLQASLSPLLKAPNCGMCVLSLLWSIYFSNDLADCIAYLFITIKPTPTWSVCPKHILDHCVATKTIQITCENITAANIISSQVTSSHYHYMRMFKINDRTMMTRKLFILAIVWINNFFLCTVSDQIVVKIFSISFLFRNISSAIALLYLSWMAWKHLPEALMNILNFNKHVSLTITAAIVIFEFGVGIVGTYDFGTLTQFLIVDNAVVMFAIVYTLMAFMRSFLVAILSSVIRVCVKIEPLKGSKFMTYHYFLFALMPLGADFLKGQKLFTTYLYINLIITLCVHICAVTYTVSKILNSEFRQVKSVYISGSICFIGFMISIVAGWNIEQYDGYLKGFSKAMLFLAAFKSAVVMYVYGVRNFCADIQFWLGFKPTKYWIVTWRLLPIILLILFTRCIYKFQKEFATKYNIGIFCMIFVLSLTLLIELWTFAKYISMNNLTGLLRPSVKYGPPDAKERKRRRNFNESLRIHQCAHNCVQIDDKIDCNHMPIIFKSTIDDSAPQQDDNDASKDESILEVFKASTSKRGRPSEPIDAQLPND